MNSYYETFLRKEIYPDQDGKEKRFTLLKPQM